MQGFSTIVPFPWQRGHGCENAKSPCESETTPRPPHCGQTTGEVPGSAPVPWQTEHTVSASTGTRTCTPSSESSNEIRTCVSRSSPRVGRRARALRRAAAEHAAEEVAQVAEVELLEPDAAGASAAVRRETRGPPAAPNVS